jgi:cytochrome c oxidase cbb3-type subunit 3/ubiquinol-cytochrome c reductase cytochrome c subunit
LSRFTFTPRLSLTVLGLAAVGLLGCRLPGKPAAGDTPVRPDQVSDFKTLYNTNCAACHGENGQRGAAISLANPAYLAYAGEENITMATANGIPGSLMPGFGRSAGGLLTDQQVRIIAHGLVAEWGQPQFAKASLPPYHSTATGDAKRGEQAYGQYCLGCHKPGQGSLLDPSYLALITDGGLRTIIVAGKPEEGMPNWAGYRGGALNDQQIADIVAFLAAHRTLNPGQPYINDAPAMPVAASAPKDGKQ